MWHLFLLIRILFNKKQKKKNRKKKSFISALLFCYFSFCSKMDWSRTGQRFNYCEELKLALDFWLKVWALGFNCIILYGVLSMLSQCIYCCLNCFFFFEIVP